MQFFLQLSIAQTLRGGLGPLSADSETRDPNPTLYYRPQIRCDHG